MFDLITLQMNSDYMKDYVFTGANEAAAWYGLSVVHTQTHHIY